jgi:4,5-dihydroxyphthalate decarboxylase
MPDVILKAVTRTQGCTRAIKDGTVAPRHFGLSFEEVPVLIHAFRRMVRALEFDVSEMAFSTYLCAKAHGVAFTALPVFLVRGFHHAAIVRGADSASADPRELEGRRVGVNRGYTVTTGVWARGILADQYDVDLEQVTWVRSGDEHVAEYQPPSNVVPLVPGGDMAGMVAAGELAAGIGITAEGRADLAPLIPDPEEAGYAALRDRGFYPINHLVVVRDDVLARYPDLAADLFFAYAEAKSQYVARLRAGIASSDANDLMYGRVMEMTGADPLPFGIAPNRPMIEQLMEYAVSQHILDKPFAVDEVFAAGTHDLTA